MIYKNNFYSIRWDYTKSVGWNWICSTMQKENSVRKRSFWETTITLHLKGLNDLSK